MMADSWWSMVIVDGNFLRSQRVSNGGHWAMKSWWTMLTSSWSWWAALWQENDEKTDPSCWTQARTNECETKGSCHSCSRRWEPVVKLPSYSSWSHFRQFAYSPINHITHPCCKVSLSMWFVSSLPAVEVLAGSPLAWGHRAFRGIGDFAHRCRCYGQVTRRPC